MRASLLMLALAACGGEPKAPSAPPPLGAWTELERTQLARMRLPDALPPDPTNRWADDPQAAALGRHLFYDAGLSPSGRFSCASCHLPELHFTDGLARSVGVGELGRHTPGIEGSQLGPWFFWDGRADSLWAQAVGPLESPVEMGSDRMHVVRHVLTRYREPYEAIFGPAPDLSDGARFPARARPDDDPEHPLAVAWAGMSDDDRHTVDGVFVHAVKAIAAFERTLIPGEAPLDRYVDAVLAGDPEGGGHLTEAQVRGLEIFLRRGACVDCHHGPFLTDRAFHPLGLPETTYDPGRIVGATRVLRSPWNCTSVWSDADDCPELRFLNPTFEDFRGGFKTPTLRNVTATAPYMHHGELATLRDVIDFYNVLPGQPAIGHRELTLKPLGLSERQIGQLMAFLEALQGPVRPEGLPPPDEG